MCWGGQGGCEWRSEAFVKIKKKKNIFFFLGGVGRVGLGGGGCQGGREQRIEAFVKIKKKYIFFFGGGGQLGGGGSGWIGKEN